jgi:hypothetical protein
VLHEIHGSIDRSMVLMELLRGGVARSRSVLLRKMNLDLFFMNLELVKLCQTGSTTLMKVQKCSHTTEDAEMEHSLIN